MTRPIQKVTLSVYFTPLFLDCRPSSAPPTIRWIWFIERLQKHKRKPYADGSVSVYGVCGFEKLLHAYCSELRRIVNRLSNSMNITDYFSSLVRSFFSSLHLIRFLHRYQAIFLNICACVGVAQYPQHTIVYIHAIGAMVYWLNHWYRLHKFTQL